jgi:hypothetical protein
MSTNLFQNVLTNVKGVEEKLLGPTYSYWDNIKSPSQIGMSDKGTLPALEKDISGIIEYSKLLITGDSTASKTGKPLGNKFFLQTGGKCTDTETKELVDRYIYVNNVPQGNIPFISSGMGQNFKNFRGLIPGTMSSINVLNPFAIMQSFMLGTNPPCQKVRLETINNSNASTFSTNYVTLVDIQNMDPCNFNEGKNRGTNPITKKQCSIETFENLYDTATPLPNDTLVQIYFASIAIMSIYVLFCIQYKSK